jgi:pyruvate dehydrogenase E1 component alpha subunit
MNGKGLDGTIDPVFSGDTISLEDVDGHDPRGWLTDMIRIRTFETVLDGLSMKGLVPGGVHTAIGQEGVAVGIAAALEPVDVLTCGHRAHHHTIAKGVPLDGAMAELFGRATGISGGRGGTMHMADLSRGLLGGNGIVGASVGIALGSALAAQLRGDERIAVGVFGDGGANTGRVWESANLAAVWQLPLLMVCENNQYAVQTPIRDTLAGSTIADRAVAFGVPAVRVDGQDVGAVYRAVRDARRSAVAGGGPAFIEVVTYRYLGHSTGEAQDYRPQSEVDDWRDHRDPIARLSDSLVAGGVLSPDDIATIAAEADAEVAAAVMFATDSPWPELADALGHVAGVSGVQTAPSEGDQR